MFGSGTFWRIARAIGLMRLAGMTLPVNACRPLPSALPVPGSKIVVGAALRSPLRNAAVGTVARWTRPLLSSVCW